MRMAIVAALALAFLASAACSRQDANAPATGVSADQPLAAKTPAVETASVPAPTAPEPPAPEPPATLTDVNLVAADVGGAVEELTGVFGPGLLGNRMIDGLPDPAWFAPIDWSANMMFNEHYWIKFPHDIVFSFAERQPALVGAVAIRPLDAPAAKVTDASTAPASVEIWTSMEIAPERFAKIASATLEAKPGEQTIEFPAIEARFVRLRLLSGASPRVVEIAEVRVLESVREGYQPLFSRVSVPAVGKGSPREAAQRGLEWLQQSAVNWSSNGRNECFGCHVHAQALMGQAVALEQGYRVSKPGMQALADFMRKQQTKEGTLGRDRKSVV